MFRFCWRFVDEIDTQRTIIPSPRGFPANNDQGMFEDRCLYLLEIPSTPKFVVRALILVDANSQVPCVSLGERTKPHFTNETTLY